MSTTWINRGHLYAPHVTPVLVDCRFQVARADTGGYGITGLKGQGVSNVYMHTSATAATGNPNPADGGIVVHLADNFSQLYEFTAGIRTPVSGSDVKIDNSAMTAGVMYVITTLGNATLAKWQTIGVPKGVTPAVGVAFVALTNGGAGNVLTSKVQVIATAGAGINHVELVGDPQLTLAPIPQGGTPYVGGWLFFACMNSSFAGSALATHTHDLLLKDAAVADGATTRVNAGANLLGANTGGNLTITGSGANGGIVAASAGTPAGTVANAQAQPADGTIIRLLMYLSQSSVTVLGE